MRNTLQFGVIYRSVELLVPRDCVARNRGADFVQCLVPPRSARRNKALDPTALVGCPQASLLPSAVLAGQRRDWLLRMNKIFNTCYMCDALATSSEHVPAKCFFPERKDLPNGIDLRKNLIKVPSCNAHNSLKSHDDEYFLYVLSGSYQINEIGRNLYRTKVRRAIGRNPSVLNQIASKATSVSFKDPPSQNIVNTVAHELDANRFNTIVDKLGRAIYFWHFKEKWQYKIKYQAEFLFATVNPSDAENSRLQEITKQADVWFSTAVYYGENPEVFKYQAVEAEKLRRIRLHFYERCKLLLIFNSQQVASADASHR